MSEMADRFRTRYLENSTDDWLREQTGSPGLRPAADPAADSALSGRTTDRAVAPRVYAVPPSAHLEEVREEATVSSERIDEPPAGAGRHAFSRTGPFWLTRPCPSWCQTDHTEADRPADRRHVSGPLGNVVLTETEAAAATDGSWQPQDVHVALTQHVREFEPLISCRGHGPAGTWHLTVAEARELAAALTRAVEATERF